MDQLIFSCRENLADSVHFASETPYSVYSLNGHAIAFEEAIERTRGKRLSVNVHGYRSSERQIVTAANELLMGHASAKSSHDVVVMWAWPGSWSAVLGYARATMRAEEAGLRFRLLLERFAMEASNIDIQAHSLGARVSLVALNHPDMLYVVNRLALTAAAVDSTALWEDYPEVIRNVKRLKVFWSKDDCVLGRAYRQAPWNWFSPAMGHVGPRPIGSAHPYSNKLEVYDYSGRALGHSDYRDLPDFYVDLNR